MKDNYIKIQLGKSKYAVARQRPGGWFGIVATSDNETMANLMLDALVSMKRTVGDRDAPGGLLPADWQTRKVGAR